MNEFNENVGLVDRLKGILSTYYYSKKNKLPFYIHWTKPFVLTDYLIPKQYDWRINESNIHFSYLKAFPVMPYRLMRQSKIEKRLDLHIFKAMFLPIHHKELHIFTNNFLHGDKYGELFQELFKPSARLQTELNKYLSNEPYYSFSFRFMQLLGDFIDVRGEKLEGKERELLLEKCLKELSILLKDLPPGYKALVASDSVTFLEEVKKLDSRIFVIPGEILHPKEALKKDQQSPYLYDKTFIDFFLIMKAEKVYRMDTGAMYASGFPHIAALIGKKPFIIHKF